MMAQHLGIALGSGADLPTRRQASQADKQSTASSIEAFPNQQLIEFQKGRTLRVVLSRPLGAPSVFRNQPPKTLKLSGKY